MKRLAISITLLLTFATLAGAQNTNSTPAPTKVRPRTTTARPISSPTPKPAATDKPAATAASDKPKPAPVAGDSVQAAFNRILEGIRHANVNLVTSGYLKSPALVLFNYNGSVTKGWEQMRKNRESSYPDVKDVKLDVRDVHVQMLGRDGAVVTCLWTQTQTYKGAPDSAAGRMTLVFKRAGTEWKAVHLHTSTDHPDPAHVPASEQAPTPTTPPQQ